MRFKYKLEVIPVFQDKVCETLTFMIEADTQEEADALAAEKKSVSEGTHILSFLGKEDVYLYTIDTRCTITNVLQECIKHEIAAFSKERADDIATSKLDRSDISVYEFLSCQGQKE